MDYRFPNPPANIPAIRRAIEKALVESGCWYVEKGFDERLEDVSCRLLDELGDLYQDYPGIMFGLHGEPDIILTFFRAGYTYRYEIDVSSGTFQEKVLPPG